MFLPKDPTDTEKYLYVNQNKVLLYVFGIFSYISLMAGMYLFAFSRPSLYWFAIFVTLLAFYLGVSYVIGIFGKSFDMDAHLDTLLNWYPSTPPTIDIYLPICGEPIEVLRNTWEGVASLAKEGYKSELITVHVLDDGGSAEAKELALNFGFEYMVRDNRGELKKAGNLRYAFARTRGELILILDADFRPRDDFFDETLPYFYKHEKLAILQTPQFFEVCDTQSWVEQGAGYVQELFYRLIQVNRDTWDAAICVGTNALYRRTALEPFGGTAAIGYSEDLHTGFNVIKAGWGVKYIPIALAKGTCPHSVDAFFVQQYRWAMGSTSLFFNPEFWQTKMRFLTRLSYLSGMLYYMATAIGIFITPIPGLVMVWFYSDYVFWYNWVFTIPSFIFGTLYLALWCKQRFGLYLLAARQISYYAHLFALLDKFTNNMIPWIPSGAGQKKIKRFSQFVTLMFWWTHLVSFLAVSGSFYRMDSVMDYNFYPLLFFTIFNHYIAMRVLRDQLID